VALAQAGRGAVQELSRIGLGHVEDLGDLGVGDVEGLAQDEHRALGRGELLHQPQRRQRERVALDQAVERIQSFSSWDTTAQAWQVAPGCDTLMVGSSSRRLGLHARVAQGGARCR
jgi:hypothetical protein